MKPIKLSFLIAIGICTTTLANAQDLQTKTAPKTELKTPPAADVSNRPSPQPEFKAMDGTEVKQAPAKAADTPSPAAKDKNSQKPQALKPVAVVAVTDVPVEKPANLPVPGPVVIKEQ